MTGQITLHATAIAIAGRAILIRGGSGAGKSTLALQLMECPGNGLAGETLTAALIADDQTIVTARSAPCQPELWCSCPPALSGLLEVRGLGLITVPVSGPAPLALVVDLLPQDEAPRLPEEPDTRTHLLGHSVPRLALLQTATALPSRLRTALVRL